MKSQWRENIRVGIGVEVLEIGHVSTFGWIKVIKIIRWWAEARIKTSLTNSHRIKRRRCNHKLQWLKNCLQKLRNLSQWNWSRISQESSIWTSKKKRSHFWEMTLSLKLTRRISPSSMNFYWSKMETNSRM